MSDMRIAPINKRLGRDLKDNLGRYIAIFVMIVAMIAIVSGFLVTAKSMEKVMDEGNNANMLEDGRFVTAMELTDEQIEKVEEKNDIKIYENYYIEHEAEEGVTLRYFKMREEVDKISLMSGRFTENKNEMVMDRIFASQHEIAVGDTYDGFEVVGMCAFVDYSSLFESNSDMIMNTKTFCVMGITEEAFDEMEGDRVYNYAYLTEESLKDISTEYSKKEAYDLVKNITKSLAENGAITTFAVSADENQAISFCSEDMGTDVPAMMVLLVIILAVIAFVFVILVNHTIDSEAVIIGTLRANGYKKGEIIRHYMLLPVIVTLVGTIIGNVLGYTVMIQPYMDLYYTTFSLPTCHISFQPDVFCITSIAPIVMVVVFNFFGIYQKMSISPLRFLRHDLAKTKKSGAIKLPNVSFMSRFKMRVLIQNAGSYLMLFFGIFMASFLLLFGLGMLPAFDQYVNEIDDVVLADYQYILKAPVEVEDAEKMSITTLSVYNHTMDKNIEVMVYGLDEFKGRTLQEDDILVSDILHKKQECEPLDELNLLNEYTEKEYIIKPTECVDYSAGLAIFMSRKAANELFDKEEDYYNGYLSDTKLDIDENYVNKVITPNDISKMADQMLNSISGMVPMIVAAAIIIHLVLMYILAKLAIDKNTLGISFLKVFGYNDSEVRRLYLRGGSIVVVLSLLISIPLEKLGFMVAMKEVMSMTEGYVEATVPTYLYGVVVMIGLVAYFTVSIFHVRKVKHIPMTESLKNRE